MNAKWGGVPSSASTRRHDGAVPIERDLRQAARVLRRIAEATTGLPDDSPADAQLRDRLELSADVLDAAADTGRPAASPK